ncbi:MAG: hypothetical protein ACRDS1_12250 [Pseudonocardiaceae bacterium]
MKASGFGGNETPREPQHSFASPLSANGVAVESITQLVGHAGTAMTEAVYRKELRPMLTEGTEVMDGISRAGKLSSKIIWLFSDRRRSRTSRAEGRKTASDLRFNGGRYWIEPVTSSV